MTASGKITVLHIIASPGIGGAERLLLTLADALDRQRFELVLALFVRPDLEKDALWNEAKKLDVMLEPITIRSSFDYRQLGAIFSIVRRHRPHVIHTHGYKTNLLGLLFAKFFGSAAISTVHGWLHAERKITRFLGRLNIMCLRHFSHIIAVSAEIRSGLVSRGISRHRITVLRNIPSLPRAGPVDRDAVKKELGIPAAAKVVGFVGRLEKVKGIRQFIQAALAVAATGTDTHFVVIGDGPERPAMEALVREAAAGAQIHFLGFLADPSSVFRSLDIYVLSSLSEGIPLTLLEAMNLGVPVIATAVGGVPEVITHGVNGILVPPDDRDALVSALNRLLRAQVDTVTMTTEAMRNIGEKYDVGRWIEKIEALYCSEHAAGSFPGQTAAGR